VKVSANSCAGGSVSSVEQCQCRNSPVCRTRSELVKTVPESCNSATHVVTAPAQPSCLEPVERRVTTRCHNHSQTYHDSAEFDGLSPKKSLARVTKVAYHRLHLSPHTHPVILAHVEVEDWG
jgi:hypothetical protein